MHIQFFDPRAAAGYDARSLQQGTGGTIAAVVRVAEGLAARGHGVHVFQRQPPANATGRANYVDLAALDGAPVPDAAVLLRSSPQQIRILGETLAGTRLVSWQHVTLSSRPSPVLDARFSALADLGARMVGCSRFHAANLRGHVQRLGLSDALPVDHVYNPVDPGLRAVSSHDRHTLLYCSSPDRALHRALELFARIRRARPQMRLQVAWPAYSRAEPPRAPGVEVLGNLPRAAIRQRIGAALCVFYPNVRVPEAGATLFGEANALGTPVLTHPLGCASEYLHPESQLVDCNDPDAVVETVLRWCDGGRPQVSVGEPLTAPRVLDTWLDLLTTPTRSTLHAPGLDQAAAP